MKQLIIAIAIMLLCVGCVAVICAIFNQYLPKWFCIKMGWHLRPNSIGFDGCSNMGTCPRCDKFVLQDSQGNWFASHNQGHVISREVE